MAREVDEAGGSGRFVACDVADETSVRNAVDAVLERDGRLNAVYPNGDGRRDIPDFTEVYPGWVWRYYENTGDLPEEIDRVANAPREMIGESPEALRFG